MCRLLGAWAEGEEAGFGLGGRKRIDGILTLRPRRVHDLLFFHLFDKGRAVDIKEFGRPILDPAGLFQGL